MPYNEEDTKLHLITPALLRAGWTGPRITMEYFITAGQNVLQGNGHRKLPPVKADYLLRYSESLPIAVVEAKDEEHTPGAGFQQAMEYARKQGLYFAYASDGHGWVEWDFTSNTQRELPPMKKVSQPLVGQISVPEIRIEDQRKIVRLLDRVQQQVDEVVQAQETTQAELAALLPVVLDKAFRGEL